MRAFVLAVGVVVCPMLVPGSVAGAGEPAPVAEATTGGPAARRDLAGRPVSTYSIVARDPATGELGVAVQSHWFSVGSVVPWAEPGVGAVATQSFVEVSYGPLGLAAMREGASAGDALARLVDRDEAADVRQVAFVDAGGRVAVHTGDRCIPGAGHQTGPGYSVQANLMLTDDVPQVMAAAFEAAEGPLAERMLAALQAAERAGGDVRGRQSAALLVARGLPSGAGGGESGDAGRGDSGGEAGDAPGAAGTAGDAAGAAGMAGDAAGAAGIKPGAEHTVDLRVEDHERPLEELARLLRLHRAYEKMNEGDEAMAAGETRRAGELYATAEAMVPDNHEFVFWHAVTLAGSDRVDEALPLFERAFRMHPPWALLVPRLAAKGHLPDSHEMVTKILAVAPGR